MHGGPPVAGEPNMTYWGTARNGSASGYKRKPKFTGGPAISCYATLRRKKFVKKINPREERENRGRMSR